MTTPMLTREVAHDLLTLCLRLCMEPTDSHSPDTMAVLDRWRKAWEEAAGGMDYDDALALVPGFLALRDSLPREEPVAWFRLENGIRVYYETEAWPDMTPLYAATQSSTATKITAPSQEGVGQGGIATAAPDMEQCYFCKVSYPKPASYHHSGQECINKQKAALINAAKSERVKL